MAVGTDSKAAMPFPVGKPGHRNLTFLLAESWLALSFVQGYAQGLRLYSELLRTLQAWPGKLPLSPVLVFDSYSFLELLRGGSL